MRKKGEEKSLGGTELAMLEEENVDWERIWSRSLAGDALPSSLRGLRCGLPPTLVALRHGNFFRFRQADVHTIITLTDNAPQGLNQGLSSFAHATQVGPCRQLRLLN